MELEQFEGFHNKMNYKNKIFLLSLWENFGSD